MKNLLPIIFILLSSLATAQSSKQRLEDLEDKLDMMRAEQDYRDAQKRIEQQNRKTENYSQSNTKNEVYKNTMNTKKLNYISSFYNLSVSEYVKRDELSEKLCGPGFSQAKSICTLSVILNITTNEASKRLEKTKKTCKFTDKFNVVNEVRFDDKLQEWIESPAYSIARQKQDDCARPILVFGK